MSEIFSQVQLRVLGTLIEKQLSTPEYYPLTRNALIAGCNQKSNRDPAMTLAEGEAIDALTALRERDLVREVHDPSGRVPRYAHRVNAVFGLDGPQAAVMCELMLRGAQTAGEIRNRGTRLAQFASVEEVEGILKGLAEREAPLVMLLPRQAGERERRWAHLLAGEPSFAKQTASAIPQPPPPSENEATRLAQLEGEIAELREQVAGLRAAFEEFKSKFE